jgi:hypothetical protein
MKTLDKLLEISSRIEHLENAAEWITRNTVHTDSTVSQTGTLICVIADDIQARITELVKKLEEISELGPLH